MDATHPMTPAETALSLLFRKLHPHLEDAAHALASGVARRDLERLHLKLLTARLKTVEVLGVETEPLAEKQGADRECKEEGTHGDSRSRLKLIPAQDSPGGLTVKRLRVFP